VSRLLGLAFARLICKWQEGVVKPMKTVFSTLEAAKVCQVSEQTIIQCFEGGQLKGYRLPGSRDRRIPREALFRFMEENGIPTDNLDREGIAGGSPTELTQHVTTRSEEGIRKRGQELRAKDAEQLHGLESQEKNHPRGSARKPSES
jgi:excisionase family DNA binding protein